MFEDIPIRQFFACDFRCLICIAKMGGVLRISVYQLIMENKHCTAASNFANNSLSMYEAGNKLTLHSVSRLKIRYRLSKKPTG